MGAGRCAGVAPAQRLTALGVASRSSASGVGLSERSPGSSVLIPCESEDGRGGFQSAPQLSGCAYAVASTPYGWEGGGRLGTEGGSPPSHRRYLRGWLTSWGCGVVARVPTARASSGTAVKVWMASTLRAGNVPVALSELFSAGSCPSAGWALSPTAPVASRLRALLALIAAAGGRSPLSAAAEGSSRCCD